MKFSVAIFSFLSTLASVGSVIDCAKGDPSYRSYARPVAAEALNSSTFTVPVDLELVLEIDISVSIDIVERNAQRDGYLAAFRDRAIIHALTSGPLRRSAVIYIEWAAEDEQTIVIPWTLIDGFEAAEQFAIALRHARRQSRFGATSISAALAFGAASFDGNRFDGARRIIDISGDGVNNEGLPTYRIRDALVAKGITINGLPLMLTENWLGYPQYDVDIEQFYRAQVIGGSDAFLISVRRPNDFKRALRTKLLREIAGDHRIEFSAFALQR